MKPDGWLGVELRHLAALQAGAREGSCGGAAVPLGSSQSAVSQQIAALERIVGERLVERPGGPRPVSLTGAGRVLRGHARGVVARAERAAAVLAGRGDRGGVSFTLRGENRPFNPGFLRDAPSVLPAPRDSALTETKNPP